MLCIIFAILCVVNNFDIQNIKKNVKKDSAKFSYWFFFLPLCNLASQSYIKTSECFITGTGAEESFNF